MAASIDRFATELKAMVENYPELEGWRAAVDADYLRPTYERIVALETDNTALLVALENLFAATDAQASLPWQMVAALSELRAIHARLHSEGAEVNAGE